MGRKDTIRDLFEMVEEGMELVEENEEVLRNITGADNRLNLRQQDMLREVKKQDDKILIITETEKEFDSFELTQSDGSIIIRLDDKDIVVNAPDDCVLEETEATLNNKVLEVSIPRE